MDRIRHYADISVRRAAGLGLVGIALVVAALHFDRTLAMPTACRATGARCGC